MIIILPSSPKWEFLYCKMTSLYRNNILGQFHYKDGAVPLLGYPIVQMTQSWNRVIFIMRVSIPWKTLYIETGAHLNIKMLSYQHRDPHVKDKIWSRDLLIFNMGIPIPRKTIFILRWGPGSWLIVCWRSSVPALLWISPPHISVYHGAPG